MDDKEKIIELLDNALKTFRFDAWENSDKIANHLITNGVVVQKTGHWNIERWKSGWIKRGWCSECHGAPEEPYEPSSFCQHCGAKMLGCIEVTL